MLYIEEARARAELAVASLRAAGIEAHLIEALERTQDELRGMHRELMQSTLFAVPNARACASSGTRH
jgi:hypothetical protein